MNRNKTGKPLPAIWLATALAVLMLLSLGFLAGWLAVSEFGPWRGGDMRETRLSGYSFINPLLECDPGSASIGSRELIPFRHKVAAVIERLKKSGWAMHISVYFRDLNNGPAFDIDGREKFTPASLIKLPLLMAFLKWEETEPGIMKQPLTFSGLADMNAAQNFKPAQILENDRAYPIEDLLYHAIVYSDNNAYFLLYANIPPRILHQVYTDLGIEVPRVRTREDYMTVMEYAAFFRILYNASYLSREHSERALQLLSETDFPYGLIAGLPANTVASHKFGEKSMGDSGEIKQLHDCGVVYHPRNPYLLCIMSRGTSFEYLDDSIREISRLVYTEVDRQHRH